MSKSKGIWLPMKIWLAEDLSEVEKLLLVVINALDNEEGCWATNAYFADFFDMSKSNISRYINKLKRKKYISVEMIYGEGTNNIEKRVIRINKNKEVPIRKLRRGIGKNAYTLSPEVSTGYTQNCVEGIRKNGEDNNINNNTLNNIFNTEKPEFTIIRNPSSNKNNSISSYSEDYTSDELEKLIKDNQKRRSKANED